MAERDEQAELDGIWSEHRPETVRRLDTLAVVARAAAAGSLGEAQRAQGIAEAHTLAGAASIFGFGEGTRLAREMERRLRDADPEGLADLPVLADLLRVALDRDRDARGPKD